MDIFGILSMIGGLALFLYGMEAMGAGLSKLSGGRMERLLEKLTSKRIMAVLLGAGVTAVIQSSSATTVMVVGFVNSGIMKLNQAVGIIMGANIGTTITSWLLSLTGIQGSSFILKMLKPSDGVEGIKKLVVETVKNAGGNPCPPIIVGVGIGGNFEKAAILAKEAVLRDINDVTPDPIARNLETELLELINKTGVGPLGLGGLTTALAVKVNTYPCHIAALPVAININCHAARHKEVEL